MRVCYYRCSIPQEVGKLLASVESTRAELAPRKRFAFRCRDKIGTRPAMQHNAPETNLTSGASQGTDEHKGDSRANIYVWCKWVTTSASRLR